MLERLCDTLCYVSIYFVGQWRGDEELFLILCLHPWCPKKSKKSAVLMPRKRQCNRGIELKLMCSRCYGTPCTCEFATMFPLPPSHNAPERQARVILAWDATVNVHMKCQGPFWPLLWTERIKEIIGGFQAICSSVLSALHHHTEAWH